MEQQQPKKKSKRSRKPAPVQRVAVSQSGVRYRVTGADGKYLYCEGGKRFLHASGYIAQVVEEAADEGAEVTDDGD